MACFSFFKKCFKKISNFFKSPSKCKLGLILQHQIGTSKKYWIMVTVCRFVLLCFCSSVILLSCYSVHKSLHLLSSNFLSIRSLKSRVFFSVSIFFSFLNFPLQYSGTNFVLKNGDFFKEALFHPLLTPFPLKNQIKKNFNSSFSGCICIPWSKTSKKVDLCCNIISYYLKFTQFTGLRHGWVANVMLIHGGGGVGMERYSTFEEICSKRYVLSSKTKPILVEEMIRIMFEFVHLFKRARISWISGGTKCTKILESCPERILLNEDNQLPYSVFFNFSKSLRLSCFWNGFVWPILLQYSPKPSVC